MDGGPPPPPPPPGATFNVSYATYLGGSGEEEVREPTILPDGRLLIGSRTFGGMPTTGGAFQPGYGGGTGDAWIGILSAAGQLDAGSYLGGSGMERPPYGLGLFSDGDIAAVVGSSSQNIPTPSNAYRTSLHSPTPSPGGGFLCRIAPDLTTRRWCTYLGGGWPRGGLTVASDGDVVVAGRVAGDGFSPTSGAFQAVKRGTDDGFVMKVSGDGRTARFATRIGGSGSAPGEVVVSIREEAGGYAINGISTSSDFPVSAGAAQTNSNGLKDSFFGHVSSDGSDLTGATLFGGSGQDLAEHRMWLLPTGSRLGVGFTNSSDLPGTSGSYRGGGDSFVAQISSDGRTIQFARYLGGSGSDALVGPTVDPSGRIYVYGRTSSRDLPVTPDAIQGQYGGGPADGVLYVLSPSGVIEYVTYLGGAGDETVRGVAIGADGAVYLVGRTDSPDFPTTPGALQPNHAGDFDGFIVKLVPGA